MGNSTELIKSVYSSDREILSAIHSLYLDKWFELDVTYGKGKIWKGIKQPSEKWDLNPQDGETEKVDIKYFPESQTIETYKSIVCDLPFLWRTGRSKNQSVMCRKFSSFSSKQELLDTYDSALNIIRMLLKKRGILALKCQYASNGRQNHFIHNDILSLAREHFFNPIDLFVKVNQRVISREVQKQGMARKHHSYWWVFRRTL